MTVKTIIAAALDVDKKVAATLVESALAFCDAVWDTYKGDEIAKDDMTGMLDAIEEGSSWKGTRSAAARRSEWKAAINAVPFSFREACQEFKRANPVGFTRVAMFKLARECMKHEYIEDAVAAVVEGKKAKQAKAKARSLVSTLKAVFAVQTRKRKEIAFRKELAALMAKHGIELP